MAQAGPQLQAPLLREADSYLWVETRSCQNSPNPSSDSPLASPTQRTRYVQGLREAGGAGEGGGGLGAAVVRLLLSSRGLLFSHLKMRQGDYALLV